MGYYSNISFEAFITPDFSPTGITRNAISWLLNKISYAVDSEENIKLKRAFLKAKNEIFVGSSSAHCQKQLDFSFLRSSNVQSESISTSSRIQNQISKPVLTSAISTCNHRNSQKIKLKLDKYRSKTIRLEDQIRSLTGLENISQEEIEQKIQVLENEKIKKLQKIANYTANDQLEKEIILKITKLQKVAQEENEYLVECARLREKEKESLEIVENPSNYVIKREILDSVEQISKSILRQNEEVTISERNLENSRIRLGNIGTELERCYNDCINLVVRG